MLKTEKVKVIIADDHPLIRQGIRNVLQLEPALKVIAETTNGKETVAMAKKLLPDVILMDINMPLLNGMEATKIIKRDLPQVKIIALTIHDEEEYIYEMVRSGATGYLLKDVDPGRLVEYILKVSGGESVIHPSVTAKLFEEFNRLSKGPSTEENILTTREQEVIRLIARGLTNKEIARDLFISEKTVKNHVSNIFKKIDVADRTQAAVYAIKNNLADI